MCWKGNNIFRPRIIYREKLRRRVTRLEPRKLERIFFQNFGGGERGRGGGSGECLEYIPSHTSLPPHIPRVVFNLCGKGEKKEQLFWLKGDFLKRGRENGACASISRTEKKNKKKREK